MSIGDLNTYLPVKAFYISLMLVSINFALWAQQNNAEDAPAKKQIEILSADALSFSSVGNEKARKLLGNVKMRQGDVVMDCDSAYFYTQRNAVDAFGNVYIQQGDSLDIWADSLKYNGDLKVARLFSNVKLVEPRMTLTTDLLIYHMDTKTASYFSGGHVIGQDMDLTSERGYYNNQSQMAYFRTNVKVKGSDYTLAADTLGYDVNTETSYFYGPTDIVSGKNIIYCENGWYNTITKKSRFGINTIMQDGSQTIYADSLYYDQAAGYGDAWQRFSWVDTSMNIVLQGNRATFQKEHEYINATGNALLTYVMSGDSLFLHSDTLISRMDTSGEYREFLSYYGVRIYKSDLQGTCDSLFYSYRDSTIRMYYDPILWTEDNQLTGDTISLELKNEQLHAVELYDNGFIVTLSEYKFYDQIKGRHVWGYFNNGALDKMRTVGNGETVYYGKDARSAYIGVNKAICSDMWIYMKNAKVSRIHFLKEPQASFNPIQQINPENFKLKGFSWRVDEKPVSKADLFPDGIEPSFPGSPSAESAENRPIPIENVIPADTTETADTTLPTKVEQSAKPTKDSKLMNQSRRKKPNNTKTDMSKDDD